MAGQGKGVLRIAIEDFFTTTKIGQWIASWFKDWGEAQEQAVFDSYKNFLQLLDTWAKDPNQALPKPPTAGGGGHQGEILTALGFAGEIGSGVASSFMAPIFRLINYHIDKGYRTNRFDPNTIIQLYFRNKALAQKFYSDYAELGWADERFNALFEAQKPLIGIGDIDELVHRKIMTEKDAIAEITKHGYNELEAQYFLSIGDHLPGIGDLVNMADRWAWDDSIARRFGYDTEYPAVVQDWVEKLGFDKDWFIKYWRAHWQLPGLSTVFDMVHRLRPGRTSKAFTDADLTEYLKTTSLPPYFHPLLTQLSYNPYSRIDVRRMYKAGIVDEDEVYETFRDLGYDDTHAKNLAEFTKKWAIGEDSSVFEKKTALTESLLSDMYAKSVIDEATFRAQLAKLHYPDEYIDWLVQYTNTRRKTDTTPDEYPAYQSKMKSVVLAAYTSRQINASEATTALRGAGFTDKSIQWLLQSADYDYLQGERNNILDLIRASYVTKIMDRSAAVNALGRVNISGAEQNQLLSEWDNSILYRTKRLSETDYTDALKLGIISQDKYVENLQGLGLSDNDITIKLALYQAAQTQAQANQKAQQVKLAETAAKKLSVTDLLDGYAKGTITEDQLYARMKTAGFTTDDVSQLIATHYKAPKPQISRLTVAQIMAALKRAAITEDEVRTMLTARGYTPEDIDILIATQGTGA